LGYLGRFVGGGIEGFDGADEEVVWHPQILQMHQMGRVLQRIFRRLQWAEFFWKK
jgi:hypothetical protein